MSKIKVRIITPEKLFSSFEAEMLVVPAADGEMGILASHMPIISLLKAGLIKNYEDNKLVNSFFIYSGILEFLDDQATILAEKVFHPNDINLSKIQDDIANINLKLAADLSSLSQSEIQSFQNQIYDLERAMEIASKINH